MSKPEALKLADQLVELDGLFTSSGLCGEAAAELRRLHAENEELRKDAERYRSLYWHWEDARDMAPGGRWWVSVDTRKLGRMQGPDAAIDAAMKEANHG